MATESQLKNQLGKLLATVRKDKGFTQEQLAHKSGLDRDAIAFIETGLRWPTAKTLSILLNALGLEFDELFKGL